MDLQLRIVDCEEATVTKFRLKIAALFYGLLSAGALIWVTVRDGDGIQLFYHPNGMMGEPSTWVEVFIGGAAGVAFGLGMARMSRAAVHRFNWAKGMHIEFRGLLGPLDNMEVLAFALFSAVGEELFFRGALQSSFGLVISSLVFGLLHIGPSKKFLPWPFQAVAMGFAFGILFWLTGNLAASILAHFAINYQNLHFINKYDPSLQLPKSLEQFSRR